jgi:uncharacterized SAM-binding protein YcdF (DUF218 family)
MVLEAQVTGVPIRSRKTSRRPSHKRVTRRKQVNWKLRLVSGAVLLILAWIAWAVAARAFAPGSNTQRNRFDAIIVLGYPADDDGNPTPLQLASVTEAAREYERGVAPRVIVTGAAVKNNFVEAQVMARTAEAQGVPATAVVIEPDARDTIQNACFATRIMKTHGWHSAEVIVSPSHGPRAGLIFSRMPIDWHLHTAPRLQPASGINQTLATSLETLKTMRYLVWARWREHCEP